MVRTGLRPGQKKEMAEGTEEGSSFWPVRWLTALDPCTPKRITKEESVEHVRRADILDSVHRDKKSMEHSERSKVVDPLSHVNIGCVRSTIRFFSVDERDALDQKLVSAMAQELGVNPEDVDVDLIENSELTEESSSKSVDVHILIAAKTKLEVFRIHGMMSLLLKHDGALQSALLRLGMHKNFACKLLSKPKIVLSAVSSPEGTQHSPKVADAMAKPDRCAQRRIIANVIPAKRAVNQGHAGEPRPSSTCVRGAV